MLGTTEASGCTSIAEGSTVDERGGGDWVVAVARVLVWAREGHIPDDRGVPVKAGELKCCHAIRSFLPCVSATKHKLLEGTYYRCALSLLFGLVWFLGRTTVRFTEGSCLSLSRIVLAIEQ